MFGTLPDDASNTPERLSNALGVLVTGAVIVMVGMPHFNTAVTPPPPPPVVQMVIALDEPPPAPPTPPPPPQIIPEPPPPPPPPPMVETVPILPAPPPKPKPVVKQPEVKPPPQPVVAAPPPPVPVPDPPPRPVQAAPAPQAAPSAEGVFVATLRAYIKSITRYPMSKEARLLKPQGSVEIGFALSRSGEISNVTVLHGSGSMILDSQALANVRSGSYPALPSELWAGEQVHNFSATLVFDLND